MGDRISTVWTNARDDINIFLSREATVHELYGLCLGLRTAKDAQWKTPILNTPPITTSKIEVPPIISNYIYFFLVGCQN